MLAPSSVSGIHVLVVDDSAVARQALLGLLAAEPGISAEAAADAIFARDKMKRLRPDVIILDLELPRLTGLAFLRQLMAEDPIPVVVCSGLAHRDTEAALRATEEGAVAVLAKPSFQVREFLLDSATMLVDAVRGAAQARVRPRGLVRRPATPASRPALALERPPDAQRVVAIGASTGGTEAIRLILEALPADAPPIVITQHMPEVFTRTFADRLQRSSAMEVREAAPGDEVLPGRVLIAPGDRHLRVQRRGGRLMADVSGGSLVSRHRPSVDVLFGSVAEELGAEAVGVLLTGMGDDGAAGLLALRERGAATLVQDEASCVVFGMPRAAILRGAVRQVVPLPSLPQAILRYARASRGTLSC